MFCFGTMHVGWVQNKTHKTFKQMMMINGVLRYCNMSTRDIRFNHSSQVPMTMPLSLDTRKLLSVRTPTSDPSSEATSPNSTSPGSSKHELVRQELRY